MKAIKAKAWMAFALLHFGISAAQAQGSFEYKWMFQLPSKSIAYSYYDGLIEYTDDYTASKPKHGMLTLTGQVALNPIYDNFSYGKDGLFKLELNGKFGVVNSKGVVIVEPAYPSSDISLLCFGLARVQKDGKQGIIDYNGKTILPFDSYKSIYGFTETFFDTYASYTKVTRMDGTSFYMDQYGKLVEESAVQAAAARYKEQIGATRFAEKIADKYMWGLKNMQGEVVMPASAKYIEEFSDGLALIEMDGKFGYISNQGKIVIPLVYDSAESFSEGYAVVKRDGVTSIINKQGEIAFKDTDKLSIKGKMVVNGVVMIKSKGSNFDDVGFAYPSDRSSKYIDLVKKSTYKPDEGGTVPAPGSNAYKKQPVEDPTINKTDNTGIKLNGNWSINVNFVQQLVSLAGYRIVNQSASSTSGTIKLQLFLTGAPYAGGTLNGYKVAEYLLNPLKPAFYYENISRNLNVLVTPPNGAYYAVLCLTEYSGDYYIKDYINFNNLIVVNVPTYTAPSVSSPSYNNSSTGRWVNETCSFCNGTGKNPGKEYPPSYGLGTTTSKTRCNICGGWDVHYHKPCPSCNGKGYRQRYIP